MNKHKITNNNNIAVGLPKHHRLSAAINCSSDPKIVRSVIVDQSTAPLTTKSKLDYFCDPGTNSKEVGALPHWLDAS